MELNNELITGLIHTIEKTVEKKDLASQYGSGLVDVFATPALVGFMESAANETVMMFLPNGYITVGSEINVKHLKATPIGNKIRCQSEVVSIIGRKITFNLKAWDESGLIGEATHIRFIVNKEDFMSKFK